MRRLFYNAVNNSLFYADINDVDLEKEGDVVLFYGHMYSANVLLLDPTTESISGEEVDLRKALRDLVTFNRSLQEQILELASAYGIIDFTPKIVGTTEEALTFTVSTPSTDNTMLDFDTENYLIENLVNAQYNITSSFRLTNTDGLDHEVYFKAYSVVGGTETLILTKSHTVPKRSSELLFIEDYVNNLESGAPQYVRVKMYSTHDTKIHLDQYNMRITVNNPL